MPHQTTSPPPSLPSTQAGTLLAVWLVAFNSGSQAALQQYYSHAFPPQASHLDDSDDEEHRKDNLANELAFRARTGGFDLLEVVVDEEFKIEVLLKWRAEERRHRVRLEVYPEKVGVARRFMMEPVPVGEVGGDGEERAGV